MRDLLPRKTVLALAVLAIAALAGCGGGEKTVTTTVTQPTASTTITATDTGAQPGDVAAATDALSGLIDKVRNDPRYGTQAFRGDPAVSRGFVQKIDRIIAMNEAQGFPGIDFDPFICAQQLPTGVSYAPARVAGDDVAITGHLSYGDASKPVEVTYLMVLQDGRWKLDSTDCVEQALSGK